MAAILTNVSLLVTAIVGWIGDIAAAVVAQPLLLIPVGVGLLGTGVGIFKGFLHR